MKILNCLILVVIFNSYAQAQKNISKSSPLKLKADSIVSILYSVLEKYSNEMDSKVPGFLEASIVLESSIEGTAGGGIDVAIFELGADVTKTKSIKTSFGIASARKRQENMLAMFKMQDTKMNSAIQAEMNALENRRKQKRELNFGRVDLSSELLKILKSASSEYTKMILRNNDSYEMNSFEIELAFGIRYTAEGKLNFSIFGVGGNIGGDISKENVHTISVKYGNE